MIHVRERAPLVDHRIRSLMVKPPEPKTLCGAPITAYDWPRWPDATRASPETAKAWGLCPTCYRQARGDA